MENLAIQKEKRRLRLPIQKKSSQLLSDLQQSTVLTSHSLGQGVSVMLV
jgi:hypothetical protein